MNAAKLFPSTEERSQIKSWLDEVKGKITKVTYENGQVLFEADNSYENIKKFYSK